MKKRKVAVAEIENALAVEIRGCADDSIAYGDIGRCYGLALALAILRDDGSTDEQLARVAEQHGLAKAAERVFGWTVRS